MIQFFSGILTGIGFSIFFYFNVYPKIEEWSVRNQVKSLEKKGYNVYKSNK